VLALRLRGAKVYGLDVVETDSVRPTWLAHIGGTNIDERRILPNKVEYELGQMDLIVEATGAAALEFHLLDPLGPNGIYVLTGILGGDRPLQIDVAFLIRWLVFRNQVLIGGVNASRTHFKMAVDGLVCSELQWNNHVAKLKTHKRSYEDFETVLTRHARD